MHIMNGTWLGYYKYDNLKFKKPLTLKKPFSQ